jgi:hypothetical protein
VSFLHVLGEVGKTALGLGSKILPLVPGPIGLIGGTVLNVIDQEVIDHKTGPAKKEAVVAAVTPMVPNSGAPNIIQSISNIIEHVVGILNELAVLFPPKIEVPK